MADDVESVVVALKRHFGVQSDQDLARRLRLGRSTISSWRARQTVPARYSRLLEGEDEGFAIEFKHQTEEEGLALSLALMRLIRDHGNVVTDPRAFIAHGPNLWNLLMRNYHQALEDFTVDKLEHIDFHGPTNRFSVMAYDEFFGKKASA
jgi:hypothetical protein